MAYKDHFVHADDLITSLKQVLPLVSDPLIRAKYVGFVSIASVTVYELAVKEIFILFAKNKGIAFGEFTRCHFKRINGRIQMTEIKHEYIKRFGEKYLNRFIKKIDSCKKVYMIQHQRDIEVSYTNLITWRHQFTHEGIFPSYASFSDVVDAYEDGKEVIRILAETMVR